MVALVDSHEPLWVVVLVSVMDLTWYEVKRNLRKGYLVTKRYLRRNYQSQGWTRIAMVIGGWAATFLMTLIMAEVVARQFFGSPVGWLNMVALAIVAAWVFYRTYCATWGKPRWNEWLQRGKRLAVEVVKLAPWWALGYLVVDVIW